MRQLSPNLYLYEDTCHVYAIRSGEAVVLVDFGSGAILDELPALGISRVSAILMTHHHRDQGQGLPRAVEAGIPIWVPYTEQDLFAKVDAHWQARPVYDSYDNRQDRFSLLEPVPITGWLSDYAELEFAGVGVTVIPTPGHTTGSIALLADVDGRRTAFTGDLIAAPGKVWSLAATQWSYNGAEGVAASVASLVLLKNYQPEQLLPSHGQPMPDPVRAIDPLIDRLWSLLQDRGQYKELMQFLEQPYEVITPHLLWNRSSMANSYVLLSESGRALLIDYGYDFITGIAAGSDRTSRRPWLYTLPKLKSAFGVSIVDAVILTHYHDDHVAGCNLLREVEGAQVWAARNFADVLEHPDYYDLPCLWYDAIPVDRVLPLEMAVQWEEYTLTCYPLPGHTRHAVAIAFEVDGTRVLATGDTLQGNTGEEWNYVYNNRFNLTDYRAAAALYRRLAPDLVLSGHWTPLRVDSAYLDWLEARGAALEDHHRSLLPLDEFDLGGEDRAAFIHPYQLTARPGESCEVTVEVSNPYHHAAKGVIRLTTPADWQVEPSEMTLTFAPRASAEAIFRVTLPSDARLRRARFAADLTIGGRALGQVAEALATVEPAGPQTARGASVSRRAPRAALLTDLS